MIDLFGMTSPNVLKIVLMLEECGLPYRLHHVDLFAGEQYRPGFLAMNPNGRVPVMIDRDTEAGSPATLFESNAALLYLSEKTGRFLPTDAGARSPALQWLFFQASTVGPAFGQYVHFSRYAPAELYGLQRFESEAARVLTVLDRRLGEVPWISGENFSIADIATWPGLRTGNMIFPLFAEHGAWSRLPNLKRWFDSVSDRPAVRAACEAIDRLLPLDQSAFARADEDALDRFFGRGRHNHAAALKAA